MFPRKLNKEDCDKWLKDKKRNPITGYSLKETSPILKKIKEQCDILLKSDKEVVSTNIQKSSKEKKSVIQNIPKPTNNIPKIKQSKDVPKQSDEFQLYYPDINDKNFTDKLLNIYDYNLHKIPKYKTINTIGDFNNVSNKLCSVFEKTLYQHFISQYINNRTPYKSILLYHGVGVGKTCSAITLAETFLSQHSTNDEAKIWVVMPLSLKGSFKEQVFSTENIPFDMISNQCTNDIYLKLLNLTSENYQDSSKQLALKKIINSRYKIFTYDSYASYIEKNYIEKNLYIKDKVIIIDEAHNIRNTDTEDKRIYSALKYTTTNGINNRLVLLSATPMYNEPTDILDLLYLLLLNDKQTDLLNNYSKYFGIDYTKNTVKVDEELLKILKFLASRYISYLKGNNPFTFALKLSPKDSGIDIIEKTPKIDPFNKPIPETFKDWINQIPEGIVPSQIGDIQNKYIKNKKIDDNEKIGNANIFNNLQPMNIVYDNEIGEKGFSTFFTSIKDTELLNVRYNKQYENALMPDEQHLGRYSGKFLNICNFVKKSTGIVVIYSRYRYSGIIPIAIALEHMGFSREGTTNILDKPTIISDQPKYENIKNPKYCILTSDNKEIMGSTTIDKLIKVINDPKNIDGSKIKVILITPVASEGLSFYNTREIHLIEPWYHFNRSVQIIGRGIRNCRHQNLPLEYKNTTVFMHASVEKDNSKETIDLHAFRISTRKFKISNDIDNIINNNSLDCYLMKNINYFPKSLFKLGKIPIVTSQGVTIDYEYGDSDLIEPKCNINNKIDTDGFRKETYRHVTGNVITILKNLIINSINNDIFFINYKTLLEAIDFDEKVIMESIRKIIYPNVLLEDYTLIPHEDGIHIIKIQKNIPNKIKIILDETNSKSAIEEPKNIILKEDKETKLSKKKEDIINIDINNINNTFIALYSSLDNKTYISIVKNILENEILNERDEYIAKCLYLQGALIGKKEIKTKNNNTYIGYVNIFNLNQETNENLDATIYIKQENKYRDCTENEIEELKKNRSKPIYIPDMTDEKMPWGIYYPKKINKSDIIMNVFKIYTIGKSIGKKTGIDCTSLKKDIQKTILEQLNVPDADGKKFENCNIIVKELLNKGRLIMLPIYKPK